MTVVQMWTVSRKGTGTPAAGTPVGRTDVFVTDGSGDPQPALNATLAAAGVVVVNLPPVYAGETAAALGAGHLGVIRVDQFAGLTVDESMLAAWKSFFAVFDAGLVWGPAGSAYNAATVTAV